MPETLAISIHAVVLISSVPSVRQEFVHGVEQIWGVGHDFNRILIGPVRIAWAIRRSG
jgi:hypothetical protein